MRKIGSGLRRKIGLAASAVCVVSVSWLRMPVQTVCASEEPVILRVCNWEEYIDLGEWDDEEMITLDDGTVIFGEKPLYEEFEDWYRETYGREVRVEYSCFGIYPAAYLLQLSPFISFVSSVFRIYGETLLI